MFKHLPPLKSLRAFEAAARVGSFTDAAKELSLTQGAISYQIRLLESSLGIELFLRSARQVSLTDAGHSLFRTTHRLFRELENEIHSLAPSKDSSILTVSVSTYITRKPTLAREAQASATDPTRWGFCGKRVYKISILPPDPCILYSAFNNQNDHTYGQAQ